MNQMIELHCNWLRLTWSRSYKANNCFLPICQRFLSKSLKVFQATDRKAINPSNCGTIWRLIWLAAGERARRGKMPCKWLISLICRLKNVQIKRFKCQRFSHQQMITQKSHSPKVKDRRHIRAHHTVEWAAEKSDGQQTNCVDDQWGNRESLQGNWISQTLFKHIWQIKQLPWWVYPHTCLFV